MIEISDDDFRAQVLDSAEPVLVDFWATWCPPCRAIAPVIEELARQYQGKIKFAAIDVEQHQRTPEQYRVRSIPTLLVFKAGKVVEQIIGAVPRAKLEAALRRVA
jgi:thioredoxin 1